MASKQRRSYSTTQALAIRKAQIKHVRSNSASTLHHENGGKVAEGSAAHQRPSVVNTVAVTDSDHEIAVVASTDKMEVPQLDDDGSLSWWERFVGRKKRGVEHHV